MFAYRILLQSLLHLLGEVRTVGSNLERLCLLSIFCFLGYMLQYLSRLVHGRNRHEVGRNEERKNSSIIRRAEHRSDESYGLHRSTKTIPAHGIESTVGHTGEVISLGCLLALLLTEGLEDILYRFHPILAEDRVVACHLPVFVSQTDGITERVDLILTLEYLCLHLRIILLPTSSCRTIIVGIGITVDVDTLQLAKDNATKHLL